MITFYDLEKQMNNPDKYLELVEEMINEQGLEYSIKVIKKSGICVDAFGKNRYRDLFKNVLKTLSKYSKGNNSLIKRLAHESYLLNSIAKDFNDLQMVSAVDLVPKKRQISACLITAEIFIGSGFEFANGVKADEIKKRYPFVLTPSINSKIPANIFEGPVHAVFLQALDNVMEYYGIILRYLFYNMAPMEGVKITISSDNLKQFRQHIPLLDRFDRINNSIECWKFIDTKVSRGGPNEILFEPVDVDEYLTQHVSNKRFRLFRIKLLHEFGINKDKIEESPDTKELPPNKYLTKLEYLATAFCKEFFQSNNLDEQCLGISLAEWIRAYVLLMQEGEKKISRRLSVSPLQIDKWCIAKEYKEWVEILINGGINTDKAQIIINNFKFTRNSKDFLDCPLIAVEDKLIALPSFISHVEPSIALLSNFLTKKLDVSFKGNGFEENFRQLVNSAGILCFELKEKDYQCDALFILEDSLFFIECKSTVQPNSSREYYEFNEKLQDSTDQLNRIVDYFISELQIVKKKFNIIDDQWTPTSIYRLVVPTAMVGKTKFINQCYIVDYSIISRFFNRDAASMVVGKIKLQQISENYEGDITIKKLIDVIMNPPQITMSKDLLHIKQRDMKINILSLKYIDYLDNGDYFHLSKNDLSKFAKAIDIPVEILEKGDQDDLILNQD